LGKRAELQCSSPRLAFIPNVAESTWHSSVSPGVPNNDLVQVERIPKSLQAFSSLIESVFCETFFFRSPSQPHVKLILNACLQHDPKTSAHCETTSRRSAFLRFGANQERWSERPVPLPVHQSCNPRSEPARWPQERHLLTIAGIAECRRARRTPSHASWTRTRLPLRTSRARSRHSSMTGQAAERGNQCPSVGNAAGGRATWTKFDLAMELTSQQSRIFDASSYPRVARRENGHVPAHSSSLNGTVCYASRGLLRAS
jgi:hypothetical protein